MADATATLGLAVDSSKAESDLRRFEAVAKKTGETAEQVRDRYAKLAAGFSKGSPALQAATKGAETHATRLEQMSVSTQKAGAAAALFTRTIQGMVVALAGGGLYKALESAINGVAALGDRMQDTRLSGETLQGLRIGAAEARVSTEELNKALDTFTKVSKQAAPEAKEFYKALSNISPAFAEAFRAQAGKSGGQDERLRLIADALKGATTETQRYQLAQKALGTDNDRVIDMFIRGRQAIADYIETARGYGIMVDDVFIKKAQDAQRQLGVLSSVIADKLRVAIVDILPDLMKFIPVLERLGAGIMDFISNALPTEERPLGTLNRELEDTRNILQGLYKERDAATAANKEGGLMVSMGLSDNGLADIKTRIDKYEAYYNRLNKVIGANERAQFGPGLPKPANSNLPGFAGRTSLKDSPGTPFDSAVISINKHIAAMKADAEAVGASAGEHARLRTEAQILEAAQQKGGKVTAEQMEKIKALGQAAADAAQKLALARLASDIKFDRSQIGLSDSEQSANAQLRRIFGDDLTSSQAQFYKQQLMINDALRQYSDIGKDATKGFISDILAGKSALESLGNALEKIGNKLIDMAVDGLWGKAFGGGGGFNLLSLFGGSSGPTGSITVGSQSFPKFASGTDFAPGGWSIVGEQGPELLRLPRGAGVTSNDNLKQMMGGGDNVVHVSFAPSYNVTGSGPEIQQLRQQMARDQADFTARVEDAVRKAQQGRRL